MTSSELSKEASEKCPKCGGPLVWRQAHPYPLLGHAIFGASFIAFLILFDRVRDNAAILWTWSGIQVLLGIWLVHGRTRAKKRVLRCIRCSTALR